MRTTSWLVALASALALPLALAGQSQQGLTYLGTSQLSAVDTSGTDESGLEIQQTPAIDAAFARLAKGSVSPARVPADHVPMPDDVTVAGIAANAGFNGLTHRDQRLASGGNQFSLEPPDQGLAVGNGYVIETINTALRVRTTSGAVVVPTVSLNQFFGLAPSINRKTGVKGPFTSDPKAYFDVDTQRWFVTMLEIDTNPSTGAFLGHSAVFIAVSQTASPAGTWNIFKIDTTNATNTPDHAGCPCLGDQPLIGADKYGFYVTTNEFPLFQSGFNGAQVYAMSKAKLAAGTLSTVVTFSGIPLAESIAYSLQPAITAQGDTHVTANNGTEYFLSALDFNSTLDNRIAVWALTNTKSLDDATPSVSLASAVLDSEVYGMPPMAQQPSGPTPLGDLIQSGAFGKASAQPEPLVSTNDDRMQQVTWAHGRLWSALNSVVKPKNGPVQSGLAYFVVAPAWAGSTLGGTVTSQGYVSLSNESLMYPSVGVNAAGKGVIAFSLVGDGYYPSVGYVPVDESGIGALSVVAVGAAPDDGFTGYPFFGSRIGRWGDYSAAVADASGTIWFANEYIPNKPRTLLANWGTFIGHVTP